MQELHPSLPSRLCRFLVPLSGVLVGMSIGILAVLLISFIASL